MELPTLHTERLVLLPLGPDDLDEAAALYADPEVMRLVAGGVKDRRATAAILEKVGESWRRHGHGLWAIRDSTTGAFLGEGGLQPTALLDALEADVETDFGFTMCRRSWGKGLATEAGEVMLRDAWERFEGACIHGLVTVDNVASQRVLAKLGFARVRRFTYDDRAHELWAVQRPPAGVDRSAAGSP